MVQLLREYIKPVRRNHEGEKVKGELGCGSATELQEFCPQCGNSYLPDAAGMLNLVLPKE
jgi:hypothetical protein